NSSWHSSYSQKMHWKKSYIYSNKRNLKMYLSKKFIIFNSKNFIKLIVKSSKQCKNCSHRQNIMKMCNNIISIMQSNINPSISQNNSSQTSNCKQKNKSNSKQQRSSKNNNRTI